MTFDNHREDESTAEAPRRRDKLASLWTWILDSSLVFCVAAYLVWPIFSLDYSDKWASIESTFISDARFLKDHWPHPLWHPLWYTGTRFDYIYPPALRYGTALPMVLNPKVSPAWSYHFYIGLLYCLGIAGVYVVARAGEASRKFAILAALLVATVSPSFLLIGEIRHDARASWSEPQRLGVLIRYGEGPHVSAVALLGFALAFSMFALKTGSSRAIAAAAVSAALVVSHNFYGATALAIFFPLLMWSIWLTHQDKRVFVRTVVIGALAYGLCAFWLVPSYLTVTLDNMRFVSERGNRWSIWVALALLIFYLKLTEKWAKGRQERAYAVFLIGAFAFFFLNVIGNYYLGFRVIGEPFRMVPELDLVLILAGVEVLRRIWESSSFRMPKRVIVAVFIVLVFYSVRKYITGGWHIFVPERNVQARLELQITDWIAKNMPDARSYTTGSVRFWFNAWHDLAQLGGGSEQGLLNPVVQPATWNLGVNDNGKYGLYWMQATGVDLAVVNDERSKEHYHDIQFPKKFIPLTKLVYDDGAGNLIYQVPRRYAGLARVVDVKQLDAMVPLPEEPNIDQLLKLVEILENGPDAPAQTKWVGTDELQVHGRVGNAQTMFVQVAFDPSWHAYAGGKEVPVRKSQLNFMRIDVPEGTEDIVLRFSLPMENVIGRVLFGLAVLLLLAAIRRRGRLV